MTAPPPLAIEHSVRASALEPLKTWRLSGDTLWMCVENQPDFPMPLAAIRKLRIAFEPSRAQLGLFRCHLYNSGGKCASIQSGHFKGFASFEDRAKTYLPFVRALVARVAAVNPDCQLVGGTSWLSWWLHALFLSIAFGFLAIVMFLLYSAIGPLVVVKLIIIAFFIPTTILWFTRNRPRSFSPDAIPANLLPKVTLTQALSD